MSDRGRRRANPWVSVLEVIWRGYGGSVPRVQGGASARSALGVGFAAAGPERMMRLYQRAQPRVEDMGVDLGRGEIGMTQQRLDHPQVGPARQQMRGKGVAQPVRGHEVGIHAG